MALESGFDLSDRGHASQTAARQSGRQVMAAPKIPEKFKAFRNGRMLDPGTSTNLLAFLACFSATYDPNVIARRIAYAQCHGTAGVAQKIGQHAA